MFFSPSRAVLSAILRDEYLTSAVRTKEGDRRGQIFIYINIHIYKYSYIFCCSDFNQQRPLLTEGGLPVVQLHVTRQRSNDSIIGLKRPLDLSFTADFKVRTFQKGFLSVYYNLLRV